MRASQPTEGEAMKKYVVLYQAPISAFEQLGKSTPEQQKAGMDAWMGWAKKAEKSIVDLGQPLGIMDAIGAGAPKSKPEGGVGGYSILQGDSIAQIKGVLDGHPHLMVPGGWISVHEVMPIPGM
jgi:hypothetical protein